MTSHLTILANNKPLTLPDDLSVSVEMSNPLFNDNEMFSYPVQVPFAGNRHILKNLDDCNSDIRPVGYEHTPMQILADGMPLASGTAVVQEDEELDGSISVNIDASRQSFQDLIGDLKCNEVPIAANYRPENSEALLIGEKIDEVVVQVNYKTDAVIKYEGKKGNRKTGSIGDGFSLQTTVSPQALGFSYPGICEEVVDKDGTIRHIAKIEGTRDYPNKKQVNIPKVLKSFINVTDAYPVKPFCNARICYAHYDLGPDGTTSSDIVKTAAIDKDGKMYEDYGKLWVLDADRPQSGICFYVLFFLDCLFEHLGVAFDKSALMQIGDLQRLCFFTTKCSYTTKPKYANTYYTEADPEVQAGIKKVGDIKQGFFNKNANSEKECKNLFDDVNEWLESRGCGGRLKLENPRDKNIQSVIYTPVDFTVEDKRNNRFYDAHYTAYETVAVLGKPKIEIVGKDHVSSIVAQSKINKASMSASIVSMYADERNFPEESVSAVISSLENQFGIKFHYDYEQKKVTAYLLRDVFRKQNILRPLHARTLSFLPISEKITGVRIGYSAESDAKDQRDNIRNKVKDYNTDFDYIDYRQSDTVTNLRYQDILHQIHNNQMKLFIDQSTGNKYRVKIKSEYTTGNDMDPKIFEVGAHKGVEIGDCSEINEDFIHEMRSDFIPLPLVDINYPFAAEAGAADAMHVVEADKQPTEEGKYTGYEIAINTVNAENIMAAFFDEGMEHEFLTQQIRNPFSSQVADFYIIEELELRESYDPSQTDDGNSPLQSYDWGLTIAIMRGGGVDSKHEPYDPNYDGFGNSKWRSTVGKYALTTDSIDHYGNVYDYNDEWPGIGTEERFSLKPRAWVQPEWADHPLIVNDPAIKNRGYVDTFLSEYAHFLLNRHRYRVRCLCTVAQIVDIPNHWHDWWLIDDKRCLINKVNTDITVKDGVGEVELEVYSL